MWGVIGSLLFREDIQTVVLSFETLVVAFEFRGSINNQNLIVLLII